MKSTVWTYRAEKPKCFLVKRYHYIENQDELNKLIEKLLDIDAVMHPADIKFPCMLEVEDGFGVGLVLASLMKMRLELKELQKMVDKAGSSVEG